MSDESSMRDILRVEQPLGPRLRVARENAGLSLEELAQRIGVETASVAAWENDERPPRANRLMMLCGVLDISIKWLLEGREDAYRARDDDSLAAIGGEFERLRAIMAEVNGVLCTLSERVDSLQSRHHAGKA